MFVDGYIGHMAGRSAGFTPQGAVINEIMQGSPDGRHWDSGYRRPYFDKNGRPAVTINTGRTTLVDGEQIPIREHRLISELVNKHGIMSPVFNATSLRKEEWIEMDKVVLRAARFRLRLWADLMANNPFGGFNGMGK